MLIKNINKWKWNWNTEITKNYFLQIIWIIIHKYHYISWYLIFCLHGCTTWQLKKKM